MEAKPFSISDFLSTLIDDYICKPLPLMTEVG